jgi:hypothetical protein
MDNSESKKRGLKTHEWLALMLLGAGLVFGLIKMFKYATRKSINPEAQNMAVGLAQGIKQFRQEYGSWPVTGGEKHRSDATFLFNLLGSDTKVNKRGINFLTDIRIAKGTPPFNGLHRSGDSGEIFDPWGNHFIIVIDHDNDGWVENPEGPSRQGTAKLNLPIAVLSPGKDGVLSGKNREGKDSTKDNWRSW